MSHKNKRKQKNKNQHQQSKPVNNEQEKQSNRPNRVLTFMKKPYSIIAACLLFLTSLFGVLKFLGISVDFVTPIILNKNAKSCYELGMDYWNETMNLKKAEEALQQAQRYILEAHRNEISNSKVIKIDYELAKMYMESRAYDQAELSLRKVLLFNEAQAGTASIQCFPFYYDLARLAYECGEYTAMQEQLQKMEEIIECNPEAKSERLKYYILKAIGASLSQTDPAVYTDFIKNIDTLLASAEINPIEAAQVYCNSANIICLSGDPAGALQRLEQGEEMVNRLDLVKHEKTKSFLLISNSRALFLSEMGQTQQACESLEQAIQVLKETYDADHPSLAGLYLNYANQLIKENKMDRAERYMKRALHIFEEMYGRYNIDYAMSAFGMGKISQSNGDNATALDWYEKSYTAVSRSLGKSNPMALEVEKEIKDIYQGDDITVYLQDQVNLN